ncbi:MAG: FxLYD domain-containing protein [Streptosporangiaceae bacterium]
MAPGYEVRFFDLDLVVVRRRLQGISASYAVPRQLVRRVMLENEVCRSRGAWVNVHSDGTRHVLSLVRGESRAALEVPVADFGAAREILEELGLTPSGQQESYQETWEIHGIRVQLSEWPGLPPSVEITGPLEEHVTWAARQLGLDLSQARIGPDPFAGRPEAPRRTPAPQVEPFNAVELGWSFEPSPWDGGAHQVSWAVVIENPNRSHYCERPTVQVTVRDETGHVVGTDDQVLDKLPPGARIAWAGAMPARGRPHTLEVLPKPAEWYPTSAGPDRFPPFTYLGVRFSVRNGACVVTGEVGNPYPSQVGQVALTALFRDARGELLGGETAFVDGLPARGSTPFKVEGTVPEQFGQVTSLDLLAVPWGTGTEDPWDSVLGRR